MPSGFRLYPPEGKPAPTRRRWLVERLPESVTDAEWAALPDRTRRYYRDLGARRGHKRLWPTTTQLRQLWARARHPKAEIWKPAYRTLQRLGLIADWVLFPEERDSLPDVQH